MLTGPGEPAVGAGSDQPWPRLCLAFRECQPCAAKTPNFPIEARILGYLCECPTFYMLEVIPSLV